MFRQRQRKEDKNHARSFSRNIGIITKEEQEILNNSTVIIAGLGGIGGSTMITLARMGVGNFVIADFDKYVYENINRQYGANVSTVDRFKVDVMAEEALKINPRLNIKIYKEGFTKKNASEILNGVDIAVDAIDFYCINEHLEFHRTCREKGIYIVMGSPIGFSSCLQVFDPDGMSLEEYCGIKPKMLQIEKHLRYACGVVPYLTHIEYFDVSKPGSNTNFIKKTGPSIACACDIAVGLVATEIALILTKRRKPRAIPYTFQFDPYTFRYEKAYIEGGMTQYDPTPVIEKILDKSSMVLNIFDLFYRKSKANKIKVEAGEICYRVEGKGKPLLLLSPLGSDTSFWIRQNPELTKKYKVITMDNMGSGNSSSIIEGYTTKQMADDAAAVLKQLKLKKVNVAGLALGSLIAQHLCLNYPDLIDKAIFMSTYEKADETINQITQKWRDLAAGGGMENLFDESLNWVFSDKYIEENREELYKLQTFYQLYLQKPDDFIRQSLAGVNHDTTGMLGKITCPVKLIHGELDKLISVDLAQRIKDEIPGASLTVLNGASHFFTWEQAENANKEIIDFIK